MTSPLVLAVIITENDEIGEFIFFEKDKSFVIKGKGPEELADACKAVLKEKKQVVSLGSLGALKTTAYYTQEPAVAKLALELQDVAYDFLVDNGYPLSWYSLFPDNDVPDDALKAALLISDWISEAQITGVIKRQTTSGKLSYWPLIASRLGVPSIRTVQEAEETFRTCPPDQSWMSGEKFDIAKETEWLHK